jgi:hypothetical protein
MSVTVVEEIVGKYRKKLDTPQAAEYLGLGKSTLDKLRVTGGGPAFIKEGCSSGAQKVQLGMQMSTTSRRRCKPGATNGNARLTSNMTPVEAYAVRALARRVGISVAYAAVAAQLATGCRVLTKQESWLRAILYRVGGAYVP